MISPARQRSLRPPAHRSHARHGRPAAMTTRCPGRQTGTALPTDSMTPAGSWPGVTTGKGVGRLPSMRGTSDRQTPQACTRTRTSCGFGSGVGTSSTESFFASWSNRAARMSGRHEGRDAVVRPQPLVVRLEVEALQPARELVGVVRPDRRVAAVLVEVPALASARVPDRGRDLALDHLVVRRL